MVPCGDESPNYKALNVKRISENHKGFSGKKQASNTRYKMSQSKKTILGKEKGIKMEFKGLELGNVNLEKTNYNRTTFKVNILGSRKPNTDELDVWNFIHSIMIKNPRYSVGGVTWGINEIIITKHLNELSSPNNNDIETIKLCLKKTSESFIRRFESLKDKRQLKPFLSKVEQEIKNELLDK